MGPWEIHPVEPLGPGWTLVDVPQGIITGHQFGVPV